MLRISIRDDAIKQCKTEVQECHQSSYSIRYFSVQRVLVWIIKQCSFPARMFDVGGNRNVEGTSHRHNVWDVGGFAKTKHL